MSICFGASGHHLRDNQRGDPDLGWVGCHKEAGAPAVPPDLRLPNRSGNVWTATTFDVFAVRDGAMAARAADFSGFTVEKPAS